MRKPQVVYIEAEQFLEGQPIPKGVCFGWRCGLSRDSHVHTIQGQLVPVSFGEWIVRESDGEHYYPIRNDVFRELYQAEGEL